MIQAEKATRFLALHKGPGAFVIPNPADAGIARLLEAAGFQALATTSAGVAFALGLRDGTAGRDTILANARAIVDATTLPVSADLENGFGHAPADCAETIRLGAEAGLVGGSIEDASGDPAAAIYDLGHAVERVRAAAAASRALPFPFTLTARAENFLHGRPDLDDTIARLRAYAEAGADVLYAPGLPSLDAIRTVCAAVAPRPVNVLIGAGTAGLGVADLQAAGARRISLGGMLSRLAYGAVDAAAKEMLEQGTFEVAAGAMPHGAVTRLMAS